MAAVILVLFALAAAALAGGGVLFVETASFADGCNDECHGGALGIAATLLSFSAGLLMVTLGVSLLEARRARHMADRDRRRRELLALLVGD